MISQVAFRQATKQTLQKKNYNAVKVPNWQKAGSSLFRKHERGNEKTRLNLELIHLMAACGIERRAWRITTH